MLLSRTGGGVARCLSKGAEGRAKQAKTRLPGHHHFGADPSATSAMHQGCQPLPPSAHSLTCFTRGQLEFNLTSGASSPRFGTREARHHCRSSTSSCPCIVHLIICSTVERLGIPASLPTCNLEVSVLPTFCLTFFQSHVSQINLQSYRSRQLLENSLRTQLLTRLCATFGLKRRHTDHG